MALLGLVFGLGLAYTLKLFRIDIDPTVALIITKLPGANCGACGKAGCSGFAEALARGEVEPSGCVAATAASRAAIAEILGKSDTAKTKKIATVLCNGGKAAVDKYEYNGIRSCKAASLLFGGYKACSFGCLGLGDCVRACPFGAMKMSDSGLPEVDPKKCTACGRCVTACPKGLIKLLPADKLYYVKCSSTDPGAIVAKACRAGCIACKKCEKACPELAIKVASNLSGIDWGKCKNIGKCFEVCPTKVIARR